MENEALEVILHMARQLVWLDVAQVCGWIAGGLNVLLVAILWIKERRYANGKHHS